MGIRTKFNPMGGTEGRKDIVFIRPSLTANGILGGSNFAVHASSEYASARAAWKAVDDSASSYWQGNPNDSTPYYYCFYNPDALNITEIIETYSGSQYMTTITAIEGSNDNNSWSNIIFSAVTVDKVRTNTLTNTNYYKYYRITYSLVGRICNYGITATYKG